jgi:hypothetical protein
MKYGSVEVWEAGEWVRLHRFASGSPQITSVLFHPFHPWLFIGGRNIGMKAWDVPTGRQILAGPWPPWGLTIF